MTLTDLTDKLLNTGSGLFNTLTGAEVAKNQAKQTTAASSSTLKIALIAGGVIAAIVILVVIFRRK